MKKELKITTPQTTSDLDDDGVKTKATHKSSSIFFLRVDWQFIPHLHPPHPK